MKAINTKSVSIFALAIACSVNPVTAVAQTAEENAPIAETTTEDKTARMKAVVITARKTEENLQTVPIAVSAITEDQIEDSFLVELDDLVGIPNVRLDEAPAFRNVASFYIRGMGYQDIDLTFEPAVGVVVDDVFLTKANGSLLDVFDLSSIEVLRGPQGTLFGRNTMAGVVKVTTKRPSGEYGAEFVGRFGNYDRMDYRAAFEAPLGETAAVRLSLLNNNSEGFAKNTITNDYIGGDDTWAGRLVFTAEPTENFDVLLTADFLRDRSESSPMNNASVNLPEPTPLTNALALLGFPADTDGDLLRVRANHLGPFDVDGEGISLQLDWDLDWAQITSITGYRQQEEETFVNVDGEALDLFKLPRTASFDQFTQELRLTANPTANSDIVAGITYMDVEHDQNLGFTLDCNLLGFPGCPAPGGVATTLETPQNQVVESIGVFAQGNYSFTPDWRLTAGLRYSKDEKSFLFNETRFADNNLGLQTISLASLTAGAPAPSTFQNFEADFEEVTWRLGTDYQFNDDIFGYLSVATGFKAGGFNGRASSFAQVGPYDPETVITYEAGLKAELFDNRMRLNGAVFFNDYQDLQIEVLQAVNSTTNVTLVTNAANAKISGIELEAVGNITSNLTANLNIGFLDAEYDGFNADLFSRGIETNNDFLALRRAPEWTLSGGLQYTQDLSNGTLTWNGDFSYVSDYETNVQNYSFGTHEAETLLNASIRYRTADEKYTVTLFGRNLTDEVTVMSSNPIPPFSSFNQPTNPLTYGVELGAKF